MSKTFYTPIDLTRNELQNARLQNLGAAPGSPVAGQVYYDTALLASYTYNGTTWVSHDASKLSGTIPNTALTTNPLARANHTGTQVAATISDFATTVASYSRSVFQPPTANIPMAGFTFTGLNTAPNAAGQAAEYSWVIGQIQSAAAGIASKPSVNVVATSNIATLSGLPTIDGITLTAGQKALLTAQTTATQNGPYIVAAGAWTRSNSDGQSELETGALWFVEQGTTYAATQWRVSTTGTITVGTTAVSIVQFGAATTYTASNGVLLTGSNFTGVATPSGGLVVSGTGFAIDTTIVPKKYSASIGDGSTTSIVVTHGLGTQDVIMAVRLASTPFTAVECDMSATSTTTATFAFSTAPTTNQFRVTIIG